MRVAVALMVLVLAGCLQPYNEYHDFDLDEQYENPAVFPGKYVLGGSGSLVLEGGLLEPFPFPEVIRLKSDLPAYGEAAGVVGDDAEVDIVMAIWRPNTTQKVPVIVDAGPYYEIDVHCYYANQNPCSRWVDDTIDWPGQTTPFSRSNFIAHGYAVVQLAVRGTGTAGGCMDLMGPSEAHDLDQAITWLGTQPWSNGRVAMNGASYDGSTPWIVAAMGNPHLKAIVPTAGLPDFFDLMFHNGTAETRGPIMHNRVYYGFGYSDSFPQQPEGWPEGAPWLPPAGVGVANGRTREQDMHNALCPEVVEGSAVAGYSTVAGDRGDEASTYWAERDYRQRVIDNYEGGVFLVHGLQDWNVDPHAAIPFNQRLRDAGKVEMMEWYGQWGHTFPDRTCRPAVPDWVVAPCRMDYAEALFRFYERHLKQNMSAQLPHSIQVQDNTGFWRMAESYPARDADWMELKLSLDERLVAEGATPGSIDLQPPGTAGPGAYAKFVSEPMERDLHLSGLPQLKLPFEVQGQGGQIGVWMFDEDPRGLVRAPTVCPPSEPLPPAPGCQEYDWTAYGLPVVGHAQMNLRYYAGGEEQQALVPGQVYEAQVEMEPLEVRIPAGNRLVIWVFQYQYPDHFPSFTQSPVTIHVGDDARLMLPALDLDTRTVFPVPGAHFLNRSYVPEMYLPYPAVPALADAVAEAPAVVGRQGIECLVCP